MKNIKKKIKNFIKFLNMKRLKFKFYRIEKKNIRRKKKLIKSVNLSKSQIEMIDNLWKKNYGKRISKDWHRLYTSYTGIFNEKYFPEIFFTSNLLHKLNNYEQSKYLEDKILLTYYFKDIKGEKYKLATNIIYNCNGYFYDDSRNNKL